MLSVVVRLQDFTGVPAVVDFAAMRDAVKTLGGDPDKINPVCPSDLVIDHSVQVDFIRRYYSPASLGINYSTDLLIICVGRFLFHFLLSSKYYFKKKRKAQKQNVFCTTKTGR